MTPPNVICTPLFINFLDLNFQKCWFFVNTCHFWGYFESREYLLRHQLIGSLKITQLLHWCLVCMCSWFYTQRTLRTIRNQDARYQCKIINRRDNGDKWAIRELPKILSSKTITLELPFIDVLTWNFVWSYLDIYLDERCVAWESATNAFHNYHAIVFLQNEFPSFPLSMLRGVWTIISNGDTKMQKHPLLYIY